MSTGDYQIKILPDKIPPLDMQHPFPAFIRFIRLPKIPCYQLTFFPVILFRHKTGLMPVDSKTTLKNHT